MSNWIAFTDGAYKNSIDVGGCGVVFVKEGEVKYKFNKCIPNTTNNRCELLAVIYALNAISKPVNSLTIYTDSQYVYGCITKGWQRKKNQDLWKLFDKYYDKASKFCNNIIVKWCKGHTNKDDFNSKMNDIADKLAVAASEQTMI